MNNGELRMLVSLLTKKLGGEVRFTIEEYLEAKKDVDRVMLYRYSTPPEFRVQFVEVPLPGEVVLQKEVEQ